MIMRPQGRALRLPPVRNRRVLGRSLGHGTGGPCGPSRPGQRRGPGPMRFQGRGSGRENTCLSEMPATRPRERESEGGSRRLQSAKVKPRCRVMTRWKTRGRRTRYVECERATSVRRRNWVSLGIDTVPCAAQYHPLLSHPEFSRNQLPPVFDSVGPPPLLMTSDLPGASGTSGSERSLSLCSVEVVLRGLRWPLRGRAGAGTRLSLGHLGPRDRRGRWVRRWGRLRWRALPRRTGCGHGPFDHPHGRCVGH